MGKINNSKNIKLFILGGIILFFGIIFIYNLIKLGVFNQDSQKLSVLNNKVVFEQPKLSIFDDTRYINQFPDTIHIHYPYFIVVVPEDTKQISTVYDLTQKKITTSFNDIVLDYYNGEFLYNYHGGDTYFGNKKLGVHCNLGFIKSTKEVLCVLQDPTKPLQNKLISINPLSGTSKDVYDPHDAITAVYFENNTLYIGKYNYDKHQAYITVNNNTLKTITFVSIIYPRGNNVYFGTFKNDSANLEASYSQVISGNDKFSTLLESTGKIVFY